MSQKCDHLTALEWTMLILLLTSPQEHAHRIHEGDDSDAGLGDTASVTIRLPAIRD